MAAESHDPKLPRILLAEDSNTSAAIVSRYLRDQFDVRCVADGIAAWEALDADESIELVLTDIEMPRLGGYELLAKIRASASVRLRELPVIVMTTTDGAERRLAFANGANDFVGKPPDALELQARVRLHQRRAAAMRELEASRDMLRCQASTDFLTGLKNRRAFHESGERHFALARRRHHDLAALRLGIDHFEEINDAYGHAAAEQMLLEAARTLARHTRAGDTPARFGGGEFAVLLPNTDKTGAALLAERICAALEASRCILDEDRTIAVTTSAGVGSYRVDASSSLDQLIEYAERRLARARQPGHARIVAND